MKIPKQPVGVAEHRAISTTILVIRANTASDTIHDHRVNPDRELSYDNAKIEVAPVVQSLLETKRSDILIIDGRPYFVHAIYRNDVSEHSRRVVIEVIPHYPAGNFERLVNPVVLSDDYDPSDTGE